MQKRKWPYLDTIGLPEGNDRCKLNVSARSTTVVFFEKSTIIAPGLPPGVPAAWTPARRRLDRRPCPRHNFMRSFWASKWGVYNYAPLFGTGGAPEEMKGFAWPKGGYN